MRYLFKVGITPHLATREISTYLAARKIKHKKTVLTPDFLLIETKGTLDTAQLIRDLGGTIVIGTEVDSSSELSHLTRKVVQQLLKHHDQGKLNFAVDIIGQPEELANFSLIIKRELTKNEVKTRFVEKPQPIQILSQKIAYIIIIEIQGKYAIFSVQDTTPVLEWQERDRGRPQVDSQSGIMPPKVARMLLNLAVNTHSSDLTIFDPFCGSGTTLMEGLMLGYNVIGSDYSEKAISDSKANLEWFTQKYSVNHQYTLLQADARDIKPQDIPVKADYIVSEGYLGPTRFKSDELPRIIAELKELYTHALPNLFHCLKPKGTLVIALPKHNHRDSQKMLQYLIDTCEKSGYTLAQSPLEYSQPNARVKRVILMLAKQ